MAKVKFRNEKLLQHAKDKTHGTVCYRKKKDGSIMATKWPTRKKK